MEPNLKPLISKEQIAQKVKEVAIQIQHDYKSLDLVIVMVMKGALCVVADLIRELHLPLDVEYVQCSSYGTKGTLRGELEIIGLDRLKIHNRDVLIVDDIFDSGNTLDTLIRACNEKHPRSIKTLVLLYKNVIRSFLIHPDYILFHIEDLFVVGYGLDYKEKYRGLNGVFVLANEPL